MMSLGKYRMNHDERSAVTLKGLKRQNEETEIG